ncbi:MAG: hypothetical protein AB8B42_03400 [Prochlorococcus sp.]
MDALCDEAAFSTDIYRECRLVDGVRCNGGYGYWEVSVITTSIAIWSRSLTALSI